MCYLIKDKGSEIDRYKVEYADYPVCYCAGYCYVFRNGVDWCYFRDTHPDAILVTEYDPSIH